MLCAVLSKLQIVYLFILAAHMNCDSGVKTVHEGL